MIIDLTGQREQIILSLLRSGKFSSVDEVVNEALYLVKQRYQEAGSEADESRDRTRQQLENLRRLGRKLDAMPPGTLSTGGTEDVADGLSNRDHDRILYGK